MKLRTKAQKDIIRERARQVAPVGVCPACRTHAAIGRAVERMEPLHELHRSDDGEWVVWDEAMELTGHLPTPLDALRAAGLTDENK